MAKEKEMLDCWRDVETTLELCERAKSKKRSSEIKRLSDSLDTCWYKFNGNYQVYKADVIKKGAKTETIFNSTKLDNAIEVPIYEYNDLWRKAKFERFADVRDALQEILDQTEISSPGNKSSLTCDLEQAALDVKNEVDSIEIAVNNIETEINGFDDGSMSASMISDYKENINRLLSMINQDLKDLVHAKLAMPGESSIPELSNANIRQIYSRESLKWKQKLNKLYLSLVKKSEVKVVVEPKPTVESLDMLDSSHIIATPKQRDQVYLEKTKPPRFDGSELEFPDFQRKWKAQVNKAGLPEESELDKLRDAVPKQAKGMLYGITTLDEAWKILSHRFGNKNLISKKLKEQLKNISADGKNDPERLMDLKIKVRNIVSRLESRGLQSVLEHDPEFLSAIYNALPERYKMDWLKVSTTENEMLRFLDETYERALKELTLYLMLAVVQRN